MVPVLALGDVPPRLTAEELRVWRSYTEAATLVDTHLDRHTQRTTGVPHLYYGLMTRLAESPRRRRRITELARSARLHPSRVSRAITRLEENGWVRREHAAADKRGLYAVLTDQGRVVLEQTARDHDQAVRRALFDRLTPEQWHALGEITRILAEGLPDVETDRSHSD
nr:MarR family transcriptional regulator [Streptomyces sp. SID5789]